MDQPKQTIFFESTPSDDKQIWITVDVISLEFEVTSTPEEPHFRLIS